VPATHPHTEILTRFYTAFAARDHATMAACYAANATFSDPVFVGLQGPEVVAMWRMLCLRAADLRVEFRDLRTDDTSGSAHWEAWYTYSATGRSVHNQIDASFHFRGGLIFSHVDRFSLSRWARQALGIKGILLGWAPPVHRAIRGQARRALRKSMERENPV